MAMTFHADHHPELAAPTASSTSAGLRIHPLLAGGVAMAIIITLLGSTRGAAANAPLDPVSEQSTIVDSIEIYVVQPGDTLWAIATRITPDGHSLEPALDHLRVQAGSAAIDVGQQIVIDHAAIRR